MKFVFFYVVFLLCVLSLVADVDVDVEKENIEPIMSNEKSFEDYKKMTVKSLKSILKAKGLECKGCSEKLEFVEKAYESRNIPDIVAKVDSSGKAPPGVDQDKLDELMESLKKGGFGNSKMFKAEDLKNMSPEEMAGKFGNSNKKSSKKGGKNSKKARGAKGSKTSSKANPRAKAEDFEVDEHTIEL